MIYALLNQNAKAWWYHKKLREWGQIAEARKRERASIRSHVELLRDLIEQKGEICFAAGCYHTSTLKCEGGSYSSSLGGYRTGNEVVEAARQLGIPVVGD